MRIDHQLAKQWITPHSRVLDLGCGDGSLLAHLQENYQVAAYGIEMDGEQINRAIAKGVNIIEQDLNEGLANFADDSFDTVVMTRALQAVKAPDQLLLDMLRVGKEAVITFPNFAHWQNRAYLGFKGLMPVSEAIPHKWYDTPNIHLCTFNDFEQLCHDHDIRILQRVAVSEDVVVKNIKSFAGLVDKVVDKAVDKAVYENITAINDSAISGLLNTDKLEKIKQLKLKQKINTSIGPLINQAPNMLADMAIYRVAK